VDDLIEQITFKMMKALESVPGVNVPVSKMEVR
jgi:hypothetical protein